MKQLSSLAAGEAAGLIAEGTVSPVDLVEACLAQIERHDGEIAAWTFIDATAARALAQEREEEARRGHIRGPLHGVPVAIKDIIDVAGMPTKFGAAAFAHKEATADAASVAALRAAGAIILGKVTTTEFAYFEPAATSNPWNRAHTPGGSSSGSAAAVAARMVPLALGTQTVGSVLRPAAYCGIIGFKATYGAVPTQGMGELAKSFDHVGVFARKVADARLFYTLMTGGRADMGLHLPPQIALVPELIERAEPGVAAQVRETAKHLAKAGAQVTEISLPSSFAGIHEAARIILEAECAFHHDAFFHDHAAHYRPRTRGLIEVGLAQKTLAYLKAQDARERFRADMELLLKSAGILLTPTAAGPAPKGLAATGDPWFCAPWSTIGVPAISLPTEIGEEGLPHAIQLIAAAGNDAHLVCVADWCESILAFEATPFG